MSTVLWIVLVVIYFAVLITLGLTTLRKGHFFLFFIGIIFPVSWLIGAFTPRLAELDLGPRKPRDAGRFVVRGKMLSPSERRARS
jgi:hypothetical protein